MCLLLKWTTKSLVVLMMIFELKISSSQCWLSDWFEWFTIGAASEGQIIRASGALACRESFIGQMVFLSWLITAASPHSQTVFITHLTPSASCLLTNKDSIQRLSKMLKAFSNTFFQQICLISSDAVKTFPHFYSTTKSKHETNMQLNLSCGNIKDKKIK